MLPTVNESVGVNKLVVFYRWRVNTCLWRQWSVGLLVSVSYLSILNVFVTEFKWFENLLDIPTCNTHEKHGYTVIVKPPLIYL